VEIVNAVGACPLVAQQDRIGRVEQQVVLLPTAAAGAGRRRPAVIHVPPVKLNPVIVLAPREGSEIVIDHAVPAAIVVNAGVGGRGTQKGSVPCRSC